MMTIDASPTVVPTSQSPRWRTVAMLRAVKWARDSRVPFSPYVADKAV